jgi:hypothetical protein
VVTRSQDALDEHVLQALVHVFPQRRDVDALGVDHRSHLRAAVSNRHRFATS